MEDLQEQPVKPRQPSKLDDHPLIPLVEFEDRMRDVLSVTPEEVDRREVAYQRQQDMKRKGKKKAA